MTQKRAFTTLASGLLGMNLFAFKSKKDEVLNHWIAFADGFNLPPQEFYDALERELVIRKIPQLKLSKVEYPEGGLLSDNRIYLRLIRERLAFDACAAPFGTGFFFSLRSIYSPAVVRLWHILVILLALSAFYALLWKPLGTNFALIALGGFLFASTQVLQNSIAMGLSDVDALLLKIPAIGPIYERCFRKDTYYRQDARMVYLDAVSKVVKDVAEEIASAKGFKLERQYERAPVLGELYKRVTPPPEAVHPK